MTVNFSPFAIQEVKLQNKNTSCELEARAALVLGILFDIITGYAIFEVTLRKKYLTKYIIIMHDDL